MKNPFSIIETHDIDLMKSILDNGYDVNKKNIWGTYLIEKAMKTRTYNMVMTLFQYGADISKIKTNLDDVNFFENTEDMEQTIYKKSIDAIEDFSKKNPNESIYAFTYEYSYEYGNILISFNSISCFETTLKEYQEDYPDDYNDNESIDELKFNPGDWVYQGYKTFYSIVKFNEMLFVETLNKVLNKMSNHNIFKNLNITDDFKYFLSEYD